MASTQQEFYTGAMQALRDGFVGGTYTVKDVHFAILNILDSLGIKGFANRLITEQVYRIIISTGKIAGWGLEQTLKNIALPEGNKPMTRSQLLMVSSINGAFGDYLAEESRIWALPMSLCKGGLPVLSAEHPQLTPSLFEDEKATLSSHVIVFAHGVCLHDMSWDQPEQEGYGLRFEKSEQVTTFYLRYNSGLAIHENGRLFAALLEQLLETYPIKIKRLTLVGHSMGGLVSRSACSYGQDYQHEWIEKLSEVATLGSPHNGAPLERIGQWVTNMLEESPVTESIARAAKQRSSGIKDLRYASLRHEDWEKAHPDEHHNVDPMHVPFIKNVRYMLLASNWKSPTGESIGDGLVPISSAHARHMDQAMDGIDIYRPLLQGLNHLDLILNDEVFKELDGWLFHPEKLKTPTNS